MQYVYVQDMGVQETTDFTSYKAHKMGCTEQEKYEGKHDVRSLGWMWQVLDENPDKV